MPLNSLGTRGRLLAAGQASVAHDTLILRGSGLPNSSALYFQGTSQQNGGKGSGFGNGLRRAVGAVVRLGIKTNSGNHSSYSAASDVSFSVRGGVPVSGATRTHHVWYRNSVPFCTPGEFNLTDGLSVIWGS